MVYTENGGLEPLTEEERAKQREYWAQHSKKGSSMENMMLDRRCARAYDPYTHAPRTYMHTPRRPRPVHDTPCPSSGAAGPVPCAHPSARRRTHAGTMDVYLIHMDGIPSTQGAPCSCACAAGQAAVRVARVAWADHPPSPKPPTTAPPPPSVPSHHTPIFEPTQPPPPLPPTARGSSTCWTGRRCCPSSPPSPAAAYSSWPPASGGSQVRRIGTHTYI
jgi:hypothetical protein